MALQYLFAWHRDAHGVECGCVRRLGPGVDVILAELADGLVTESPPAAPPPDIAALARAIPRRRTDRRRFSDEPVDEGLRTILIEHAANCQTELYVVAGDAARQRLIAMITDSASLQKQQMGYAAELARWTGRYAGAGDGIESSTVASGIDHPGEVPMRAFIQG